MSDLGVNRGQLQDGFSDWGMSKYLEPMFVAKFTPIPKEKLEDLSHLNPGNGTSHSESSKKAWLNLSPAKKAARVKRLREIGKLCAKKYRRTVKGGQIRV